MIETSDATIVLLAIIFAGFVLAVLWRIWDA
jgi:hypothetical protein